MEPKPDSLLAGRLLGSKTGLDLGWRVKKNIGLDDHGQVQPGQQRWLTEKMSFSVSWGMGPSVDRAMRTGGWLGAESRHKLGQGCRNCFGPKALLSACLLNYVRPPALSRALAAAFCPVGRKSLPTELEAIMPKRGGDGAANPNGTH